jgi:cell shape-determining protein MreD
MPGFKMMETSKSFASLEATMKWFLQLTSILPRMGLLELTIWSLPTSARFA